MTPNVVGLPPVNAGSGAQFKTFGLDQVLAFRDLLPDVYPEYSDELFLKSFAARIAALGSEKMVDTLIASHYQKSSSFARVTILTSTAQALSDGSAGVRIVYNSSSATVLNGVAYSPGGVQEVIMTAGATMRGLIVDKVIPGPALATGHYIDVALPPGISAATFIGVFAVGKIISFGGATKSELQTFGNGDIQFFDRYDWVFQKLPGFTPLMSNEFNSKLNVRSDGSPYPITQTVAMNLLKMQVRRALSLVIGSGTQFTATNGGAANEVQGIWTIGRNQGLTQDWSRAAISNTTTGNAALFVFLQAIGRYAVANQMGYNLELNHGQELGGQVQNFINTGGIATGNVIQNNYIAQQDGVDRIINLASQAIILPNGVKLDLIAEPAFNHPRITAPSDVVTDNYFPYAGYVNPKMQRKGAYNPKLGMYGQEGGPTDIEILVFGQTQGQDMKEKVKTLSVYRPAAITGTEAAEIKWTTQYTLRLAAVNRTISIGTVA